MRETTLLSLFTMAIEDCYEDLAEYFKFQNEIEIVRATGHHLTSFI